MRISSEERYTVNYILGSNRTQIRIECFEDYVDADNEVRIIDKIIDALDIQSLGFKVGNNDIVGRPMFDPKEILKLFVYGYLRKFTTFTKTPGGLCEDVSELAINNWK